MKSFRELPIIKPHVAIIGGGMSVLDITLYQWYLIKQKCFVITVNYGPCLFPDADLNLWMDSNISTWVYENLFRYYNGVQVFDVPTCCAKGRGNEVEEDLDFCFDPKAEQLKTNYTVTNALELLHKYFPRKQALLFGIDGYHNQGDPKDHWYDFIIDHKLKTFEDRPGFKMDNLHSGFEKQAQNAIAQGAINRDMVVNCNTKSKLTQFPVIKTDLTTYLQQL